MIPSLVIFDCDGVLVDSETISCRVEMDMLGAIGHPIAYDEFCRRAIGRSRKDTNAMLDSLWDRKLPGDWGERVRAATIAIFETELRPVSGIGEILAGLGPIKRCVASSSHPSRIARSLALTGLADYFGPYVFSASEVKNGKPAPDLFLYAAERMGVEPQRCLVIEDSLPGIIAARAAGMTAIGLTAAGHCKPGHDDVLRTAGADAIAADTAALAALIHGTG